MIRRIHTPVLLEGDNPLAPVQAHHARTVLRLGDGDEVEIFDNAGRTAAGILRFRGESDTVVQVQAIVPAAADCAGLRWSVASAIPKGERADWMVEKLSELGAHAFIPLATARSVVLPEGKSKRERWVRIATESAKQSRRPGVMRIDPLTPLDQAVRAVASGESTGWCLATTEAAVPIASAARGHAKRPLTLFVGPEGGWTAEEMSAMTGEGLLAAKLTNTTLRVETAAVAAAAVVAVLIN